MANDEQDEFTRGILAARRDLANAWREVIRDDVHETDFTAQYLRGQLQARSLERRCLFDGAVPVVGMRVVIVSGVARQWGLPHAIDDHVHEITSLLGGDTHLVECGARQIGVRMLRVAPEGSDVTCPSCKGWRVQLAQIRIDSEVFRNTQFATRDLRDALSTMLELFSSSDDGLSDVQRAGVAAARAALRRAALGDGNG